MAVSAATKTTDFSGFLPAEISGPIFERAARMSVVQRVTPQVPLGPNGKSIPVVTGRMSAGWVAEGATKPASAGSLTLKTMTPQKLAAIAVVSAEVVRANPGGYMTLLREHVAESFAVAFDYAALYDAGPDGTAGGGPFSTYLAQTTKEIEFGTSAQNTGGVHNDLVDALKLLIQDNDALGRRYRLTGWVFDPKVEGILLDAVDTTGRPLWTAVETPDDTVNIGAGVQNGRVLGRPAAMGELSRGIVCGFAGDFTQAAWGVVGGITYDVSTEASVTINGTLTSLWENNLVAIRAEAEYGWLVNDVDAFVELTDIQTS